MGIEALIVHKADSLQPHLTSPDTRLVLMENLLAYLHAPTGLATGAWGVARVAVKNLVATDAKLAARNYTDIANRSIFVGPAAAHSRGRVGAGG